MKKQYIYPQNMRASATLWLWSLKDFVVVIIGALFSAIVLATTKLMIPAVLVGTYALLSIRADGTTMLDFIKYGIKFFISTQQYYEWGLKDETLPKQNKTKVGDENGGKLDNRVMMYLDEMGTIPKIESAEMMFSASRSRRVSIVAIIQSFAQLNQNYGENGAEIITDNTQLTIFGGFAPNSKSAEILSKAMGNRTVMSGSISKSKNDPSQSLQMIERPLMTPDELKSMPKGQFIVMKTGSNPMISKLKLFFKWGIKFNDTYKLTEREKEKIKYSSKNELTQEILKRYPRTDRLNKTVNNSDTPYSYTQKTRRAPRFDNY